MKLDEGQVVGAYSIERRLGSGGMAVVYAAQHNKLKRTVALKMMHAGIQDEPELLARFQREARVVAKLDHPQIVPIYDFDEYHGTPYIVMKLVEGRTLKWHLLKRALPLAEVDRVCSAVADALTYAHGRGVLHRDVKPANVMIDEETGAPYLTDFGLARVLAQGESSMSIGMIVGTPHYLAPEQASGEQIGPGADVYALGVMMYEMVVGQVPFSGASTHTIVHDHIYTEPPRPSQVNPEVPVAVERVILQALEKDPADRYETPRDLLDAFHDAVHASGLTELSEDRSDVAARSLALLRGEHPPEPKRKQAADDDLAEVDSMLRKIDAEIEWNLGEVMDNVSSSLRGALPGALSGAWNAVQKPFRKNQGRPYAPPTEGELEDQIRDRVHRRLSARRGWWAHFVVFLVISVLMLGGNALGADIARGAINAEVQAGNMPPLEGTMAIAWATQQWALIAVFFWAGGVAAHRVSVNDLSAKREDHRERKLFGQLENRYGEDWAGTITQGQYEEVKNAVDNRFTRVRDFRAHLWVFIFGNAALATLWSYLEAGFWATADYVREVEGNPADADVLAQIASEPRFLIITMLWLVVLLVQGAHVLFQREYAAEDELARERELTRSRRTPLPKQKRADTPGAALADGPPAVRLTEDGELTNSTVEAWEQGSR